MHVHATHHPPSHRFRFTVHGLWPERRDGTWPQFCAPGDDLNVEEIADLVPEMERVWPSWSSDDEAFWNHEWARHGTCAMSTIRGHQHRFFETVLRLHEQLNIQVRSHAAQCWRLAHCMVMAVLHALA